MKNLNPIRRNYHYFQSIITNRDEPAQAELIFIQQNIQVQYRNYRIACRDNLLHSYTVSAFRGNDAQNLKSCYAKTIQVNRLKEAIYDNQFPHIRYECQYCMIGDSSETFDHYLPKENFPEFAVLSNNLIPCCSKCNSIKSSLWLDTGVGRNIINFYYDVIPLEQFLTCSLSYRRGTPIINYNLNNPGTINPDLYRVIVRHFARLGLLERFKKKSNTEITNVKNSIRQYVGRYTVQEVATIILNEAADMKLDYGNNFWKAIIRESLANSDVFLTQMGFNLV